MIWSLACFSLALLAGMSQELEEVGRDLPIPSSVETTLRAECRGRRLSVTYSIRRPGPDSFTLIEVDDKPVRRDRVANLNRMLGGYMLDDVSIYSCEGAGEDYEIKMHLKFSKGEERYIYLIAIKGGQIRLIR